MSAVLTFEQRSDPFTELFGNRRGAGRLDFSDYVRTLGRMRLPKSWRGIWTAGYTDNDISKHLPEICEILELDLIMLWDEAEGDFYVGSSDLYVRDSDGCLHSAPTGLFAYLLDVGPASVDLSTTDPAVAFRPDAYMRGPVNSDYNYVTS